MKKTTKYILTVLSILMLSLAYFSCESNDGWLVQSSGNLKANSKVLVEFFTNTSCFPCVPANNYLDRIDSLKGVTSNDTNVIIIRYHTNSPGPNDPFYNFNIPDNTKRIQYYSVVGTPVAYLCGKKLPGFQDFTWTNAINLQMYQSAVVTITLTNKYDSLSRNDTVIAQIKQISGSPVSDLVVHIVIAENKLFYNAANGEKIFENTFRQFATQPDGESISLNPGQTITFSKAYTLRNGINPVDSDIIIFVQGLSSKTVFGVEKKKIL